MKSKIFYLSTLHFFNDGFSESLILFLPFIAVDLHLNLAKAGTLASGLRLLSMFVALPSVFIAKRLGSFKLLLFAMFIYAAGFLGVSQSQNFMSLMVILIFTGVGFGLFHPVAFAAVSRLADASNIGKSIGKFTAWGDVGRIAFSGGLSFLIVALGWSHTAVLYGLVALAVMAYIYFFHFRNFFLREDVKPDSPEHTFGHLWGNKKFLAALASCTLDNLASSPLLLFLSFLLLSKHVAPVFLSFFAIAFLIGNILGRLVLGGWVDRAGNVKVFIATEVLMAVLLLWITFINAPWLIAVIAMVLGLVTRGTVPAARALVHEAVKSTKNFERATSVIEVGNVVAAAVAPFILGLVSSRFGIASAFWLLAGFALLAIVPAIIFRGIKSYPQKAT